MLGVVTMIDRGSSRTLPVLLLVVGGLLGGCASDDPAPAASPSSSSASPGASTASTSPSISASVNPSTSVAPTMPAEPTVTQPAANAAAPCTNEALGIYPDAMAPPTIRYCDGQWALYNPGVPGDSTAIHQAVDGAWQRRIGFPNGMCRSEYLAQGIPEELLTNININC